MIQKRGIQKVTIMDYVNGDMLETVLKIYVLLLVLNLILWLDKYNSFVKK